MIFMNNYFSSINENIIQAKEIEGLRLDQKDKERIAGYLVPNQNSQEIPILSQVDNIIGEGDVSKLFLIAMILDDKENFLKLLSTRSDNTVSKNLQKIIRANNTTGGASSDTIDATRQKKDIPASAYGSFM